MSFALAALGAVAIHPPARAWWRVARPAIPSSAPSSPESASPPRAAPQTSWPLPPVPARDRWQSWNPIPMTAAVTGFWASAPDDVWAWGDKEAMRWDGRSWTRVYPPVKQPIDAIWGAANDVWLRASHHEPGYHSRDLLKAGYLDTSLLRWNGHAWISVEDRRISEDDYGKLPSDAQPLAPSPDPDKIVGRDELTELWARHAAGRKAPAFKNGYRTGGAEIWAADADGRQLAHFDGRAWTVGARLASSDFSTVRMISASDGWAVSRRPVSFGQFDPHIGGPAGDGLFRWDGRAWRFFQPLTERVHALWAASANDVWAVGQDGLVMHWDGARWSKWSERLTGDLHAVWGGSRDDVWVNGCADHFHHWNGVAWSPADNPVPASYAGVCPALWGTSANDVSAIGQDLFLRWNGAAWKNEPNPLKGDQALAPNGHVAALWSATAGGDLWAVGSEDGWPLALRRHANHWTKLPTPRTAGELSGLWGDRDDDVWAVGSNGLILHWDGTRWSKEESGVVEQLTSIHGAGGTVWIAGERGTLLVRTIR
jgi:hypothetical protein